MAVNRRRGEVEAVLEGRPLRLCLTLGALAELEDAFSVDDLGALAERFSNGRLSARDLARILAAGLRGGGNPVSEDEIAGLRHEDGVAGLAGIVAELLTVTFGTTGPAGPEPQNP